MTKTPKKTAPKKSKDDDRSPLLIYREKNDLSLAALGKLLKANASTVMRWERHLNGEKGGTPIPVNRLAEISELTKIPKKRLRPDIFA